MAWDFSTEPEFEEKLEWMRTFVRDEIYPLETIDLDEATFRRLTDPLKEEVKKQGLWAAHLDPELGGQGFGQVKLGLMHEILGSSADFLVLMAITNPGVHPYQGTSMIIVPVDTPGVDIVRDVPTMAEPDTECGRYGNHAEIYYRDVRVPYEYIIGNEGDGFVLAQ